MAKWKPILTESSPDALRAWDAVHAIARDIWNDGNRSTGVRGIDRELCEESIFYAYFGLARNEPLWTERSVAALNDAIDRAQTNRPLLGLFGGLCGLGWTVEHLSRLLDDDPASTQKSGGQAEDFAADKAEDPNSDVDEIVFEELQQMPWRGHYDLIAGLVGIGAYFLLRLPHGRSADALTVILDHLENNCERVEDMITWHSGPPLLPGWQRLQCPEGYYNLGVAHGIPGILYFLGELVGAGIESKRASALLEGGVCWLVAQQRDIASKSRFSAWVVPGRTTPDSRLAWCYGDLGIVSVLFQIARRANREDWHFFARNLLTHCLGRPPESCAVVDAQLCHGAAGLAHIFNRIYQSEQDDRCLEAALFWIRQALNMRHHDATGIGGYLVWDSLDGGESHGWEPRRGFLAGAMGVGLALLGSLTSIEPQWDRLILASGRMTSPGRESFEKGE
jgi:hypothetical protein